MTPTFTFYMRTAFLLTGGNIGNPPENLATASKLTEKHCGKLIKTSSLYKTAAWGLKEQPDFYNQVLVIETKLSPRQLMDELLVIETQMGRERKEKMGPRIIDIDILLIDDLVMDEPFLHIPHPRLAIRRFALTPLAEVAPRLIHPVFNKTISTLLEECEDHSDVYKISKNK